MSTPGGIPYSLQYQDAAAMIGFLFELDDSDGLIPLQSALKHAGGRLQPATTGRHLAQRLRGEVRRRTYPHVTSNSLDSHAIAEGPTFRSILLSGATLRPGPMGWVVAFVLVMFRVSRLYAMPAALRFRSVDTR
jgi:hypothetical protein